MKKEIRVKAPKAAGNLALIEQFNDESVIIRIDSTTPHVSIMNGKLEGLCALSTPCSLNPICRYRMLSGVGVCPWCYASNSIKNYAALRKHLNRNYEILTSRDLTKSEVIEVALDLRTKSGYARIEAHGDVSNVQQAMNYVRIIEAGKALGMHFGVWTKNPGIWQAAFKRLGFIPDNATWILSSIELNKPNMKQASKYEWIDIVFTVYDDVEAFNTSILRGAEACRCGNKSCVNHGFCYSYKKTPGEAPKEVSENLRK